jgi:predicted transcriptional regulator
MRLTDVANKMALNNPEARRHLFRLRDVGLIVRDNDGFYHLTPYGETVLLLLQEYHFLSANREYFQTHTLSKIPNRFVKQIGELKACMNLSNAMDFLRHTENLLKESNEYVWLLVDQFPMNSLSSIVEAIERGVHIKIIEPRERILEPNIESMTSEETQALSRTRQTPQVDKRMVDDVNVYLFLSDNRCVVAFPTTEGQYDYRGFTATDGSSLKWCTELFQHFWEGAVPRTASDTTLPSKITQITDTLVSDEQIIVVGRNDPNIDAQAIQDAVDNYSEVILRGRFNLGRSRIGLVDGATSVQIRKSVVIRGEGRENDIPATKIYKRGWRFPFLEYEYLLTVDGEGIDVTVENIHFTDFNGFCIANQQGNSVKIRNNRITLSTGLGRGQSYGQFGDQIVGIISGSKFRDKGGFPGGVVIEGNYLDFALSYARGGFLSFNEVTNPNYRPDLKNHEGYIGIGIVLNRNLGNVIVRNNIVRNMNSKGIQVFDNWESADIQITGNTVISEIFGSYSHSTHFAGYGIQVLSALSEPRSGSRVEISGNEVRCDRLNYCGIAIYGMSMYREGAGKLGECIVLDNDIHLRDGSVGVLIRKNDRTEVFDNKISGKAYYGFHLWGSADREGFDLGSNENLVEDNDMTDLVIKAPDEYSDSHVDGRMFTGSEGKSTTAHVWLNAFSKGNVINIKADETVIDEGEDNITTNIDNEETS